MAGNRHWISSYLRPISLINTGTESGIERKAEVVEKIENQSEIITFEQRSKVPTWELIPTESWMDGDIEIVEDGYHDIRSYEVNHPNRHWWIISNGLLESSKPTFQSHADVFDLLLALNICIEEPVFFSQNPGQTEFGAFRLKNDALDYRDDLSPGSFPLALLGRNEIPERVKIKKDVWTTYRMVRKFRSMSISEDKDMDIRIALHMFEDGLKSTIWTSCANFYYVCENVLCSGDMRGSAKDVPLATVTDLTEEEAEKWRWMVNRLKHPDKGEEITGILDDSIKVPSPARMRIAASDALLHAMSNRYDEVENVN